MNPNDELRLRERDCVDADLEACWSIQVDAMREYIDSAYGWDEQEQREKFGARWDGGRGRRVLVDLDDHGAVVGFFRLEQRDVEDYLVFIAIAARCRGRGVGSALVSRLRDDAHARGRPLALAVLLVNPRARAFYERLGFVVEEPAPKPTHVRMVARPAR